MLLFWVIRISPPELGKGQGVTEWSCFVLAPVCASPCDCCSLSSVALGLQMNDQIAQSADCCPAVPQCCAVRGERSSQCLGKGCPTKVITGKKPLDAEAGSTHAVG